MMACRLSLVALCVVMPLAAFADPVNEPIGSRPRAASNVPVGAEPSALSAPGAPGGPPPGSIANATAAPIYGGPPPAVPAAATAPMNAGGAPPYSPVPAAPPSYSGGSLATALGAAPMRVLPDKGPHRPGRPGRAAGRAFAGHGGKSIALPAPVEPTVRNVTPAAVEGHRIVLRDGSSVGAKSAPTLVGNTVRFSDERGTLVSLRVSEVNLAATATANHLDWKPAAPVSTPAVGAAPH
jgi:U1 small nuclear ribonucleoprotein C